MQVDLVLADAGPPRAVERLAGGLQVDRVPVRQHEFAASRPAQDRPGQELAQRLGIVATDFFLLGMLGPPVTRAVE